MKPTNPGSSQKLLATIIATTYALGLLTYHVLSQGMLTRWNLPVYYFMRTLRSPCLEPIFVQISLFNSLVMSCFWISIMAYLIIKKDHWRAIHWLFLGILVGAMTLGLKYSTAIARPGAVFPVKDAFPSAHVSGNMTLLGGMILLLDLPNTVMTLGSRVLIYAIYGVWIYVMAFSRLYLAAHWLTNIVGGVLISCISLSLFALSYYRKSPQIFCRTEFTLVGLSSLWIIWLIRFLLEFDRVLKFYLASY